MKGFAKTALPVLVVSAMVTACGGIGGGGESDITARLQQEPLRKALGTEVTISYQPGTALAREVMAR